MKKKKATKFPYTAVLLVLAIIVIAALSYIIVSRPPAGPQYNVINLTILTPTPKHNISEVKRFMARVMDSYSDLPYADPTTLYFRDEKGLWEEVVLMNKSGSAKNVMIRVYDSNLTLENIFVEGPKPIVLSNDEVVTKGVVKLSGKLNCSQDKIRAFVFFDLYCPPCIAAENKIDELRQKFNSSMDFEYKIILTHSYDLAPKYGLENVTKAAGYLLCSRAQGKLEEFKRCAIDAYMKHEEVPLTPDELSQCVNSTSLDITALDECMGSYYVDLNRDRTLAETYSIVETKQLYAVGAPVVTVDCMYKAEVAYAEAAICYAHPELPECR
ncbi:MAG: DsbA family protein [Candidatus Micrarchaeota archaeon]|nr:DsbA family protein [Candidatus Micrarchaeota archaeon]